MYQQLCTFHGANIILRLFWPASCIWFDIWWTERAAFHLLFCVTDPWVKQAIARWLTVVKAGHQLLLVTGAGMLLLKQL